MKITSIEIGEYRQFKNLKFDFTYPADHAKAGKPLEKICFIGQSGTGKTTLLNVIWDLINTIIQASTSIFDTTSFNSLVDNQFLPDSVSSCIFSVDIDGNKVEFNRNSSIEFSDKDLLVYWFSEIITKTQQYKIRDTNKLGIYIRDSIANEANGFLITQKPERENINDYLKTEKQINIDKENKIDLVKSLDRKQVLSLGDFNSQAVWEYILQDIRQYDNTGRELVMSIVLDRETITADQLIKRLTHWRNNTRNPRIDLAEKCVNPLLKHFFLEMGTESTEESIVIKLKKGSLLSGSTLSSGTRQLLATSIPIYKLNTEQTVILFDEPERSLFPDVQRVLIDYYTSLSPQAQFFFATHSPIIASAFEPCERFVLYFDENGEVKFHNGVAPEGDDPNDILSEDFGLAELMLPKGLEEYERYRQLAMKIREETDEEKKGQLIIERLELGNRYNFAGKYAKS